MTDEQKTEQAIAAFRNLSGDDTARLKDLNTRIQNHTGKWSEHRGGETTSTGSIKMPWIQKDPLILEFIGFMYDKGLTIFFNWKEWEEGEKLYVSEDKTKYDNVDVQTILKIITAVIRQDRFSDGSLALAFKSGEFPKLINRLVVLKELRHLNP